MQLEPEWVLTRFGRIPLDPADCAARPDRCPLCASGEISIFTRVMAGDAPILERAICLSCGHVAFVLLPAASWLEAFYRESFESQLPPPERPPNISYAAMTDLLLPHVAPGARILDIGCGYGSALQYLGARGRTDLVGLEPSGRRAAVARTLDVPVSEGLAEDAADDPVVVERAPYDAIFSWHALEHVIDPRAVLLACQQLLRDGGALFIAVPNMEAEHLVHQAHYVPHTHSYSTGALRRAVEDCGFRVCHVDDSIRLVAIKAGDAAQSRTVPDVSLEYRLRAKFLRDFSLRALTGCAEAAVALRHTDYRGSHEVLEPSIGRMQPLSGSSKAVRLATRLVNTPLRDRIRRYLGPSVGGRVVMEHDEEGIRRTPLLDIVYRGGRAAVWVK